MNEILEGVLIGVGGVFTLIVVWRLLKIFHNIFYPYVFARPINLRKKAGASWAVITGATDGIGKEYSFQLADYGFNILLVSRTQSKLDATQKEILQKYPRIQVRTASYDFTDASSSGYQTLLKKLNEVDVGILVNNVGMYHDFPEVVHKIDFDLVRNVTIVNTLPPTLLSAGILHQMVARKAGIIINIGSSAGLFEIATWAVYSAAKKYVSWLSAILLKEYGHQGIIIQNITPMLVSTKMAGNPETSFSVPDVKKFVKSAIGTIGHKADTTGYIGHQIAAEMMALLPDFLVDMRIAKASAQLRAAGLAKGH